MKNSDNNSLSVTALTWKEARNSVSVVNPFITEIIDEIDPPNDHVLVRVTYPWGSEILKKGIFQLPLNQGGLISYHDPQFDKCIKKLCAYNVGSNPIMIILKNTVELFFDLEDRVIPFAVIGPGKIFGTWRILDGPAQHSPVTFFWGLTAGARSIFLLPKISEASGYRRLKSELGIAPDRADGLLDHWRIFKEIVNADNDNKSWETELLFFSGRWFEHKDDKMWSSFNYYLSRTAWEGSSYLRNQFIWNMIFSIIQKRLKIKSSAFFLNIIKQLLGIGSGAILGFQPAIDNSLAPIDYLQDIFVNIYNLKHVAPIMMHPAYFNLYNSQARSVYYSLQYPTSLEFAPKPNSKTSALEDLYYVRYYLLKYVNEVLKEKLNVETTTVYDAARLMQCDYFHSETGHYKEIRDSQFIFDEDPFFQGIMKKYSDKTFPKNSNFFNGCIRISR